MNGQRERERTLEVWDETPVGEAEIESGLESVAQPEAGYDRFAEDDDWDDEALPDLFEADYDEINEDVEYVEDDDLLPAGYSDTEGSGAVLVHLAEQALSSGQVSPYSGDLLSRVLARTGIVEALSPLGAGSESFTSPAVIFDAFASGGSPALRRHFEQFFQVVALPGTPLEAELLPGDILLRRALGEGNLAHAAFLVSGEDISDEELSGGGLVSDGGSRGLYAHVLEGNTSICSLNRQAVRRITDGSGWLPRDQMMLRVKESCLDEHSLLAETIQPLSVDLRVFNRAKYWHKGGNTWAGEGVPKLRIELTKQSSGSSPGPIVTHTNSSGGASLSLSEGTYKLKITPSNLKTTPSANRSWSKSVGPAVPTRPDRIWRPFYGEVTITFSTSAGGYDVKMDVTDPWNAVFVNGIKAERGRSITVNVTAKMTVLLQPVCMRSPNRYRPLGRNKNTIGLIVIHHTTGTTATQAMTRFMNEWKEVHTFRKTKVAADRLLRVLKSPPGKKKKYKIKLKPGKWEVFGWKHDASAHYLIDERAQVIKMVHELDAAIHADPGHWRGRNGINSISVGIEIVHKTGPFKKKQYQALIKLLNQICSTYNIPRVSVVGHRDVATRTYNKKKLLGATDCPSIWFDWQQLEQYNLGILPKQEVDPSKIYDGFFRKAPRSSHPDARLRRGYRDGSRTRSSWYGRKLRTRITKPIIKELQEDLRAIGYYCELTGKFDLVTEWAVRAFQDHFFSGSRRWMRYPIVDKDFFMPGKVNQRTAVWIKTVRPRVP